MSRIKIKLCVRLLVPLVLIWIAFSGCRDELYFDKYERPEWLAGKVYSQVKDQPDLSVFALCLERTGYDTIIDRSGCYTVFAPTDEAMNRWFQENQYASIEDVPVNLLVKLVSFHLIQNPWSKIQLRTVDVYGWIDTLDETNNQPKGFKRETLLTDEGRYYPVAFDRDRAVIVGESESDLLRKVDPDSRKFAPFFYSEYFDAYDLSAGDYEFYFERSFTGGEDLYFSNTKIISDEIKAENGFVYKIDQVADPLDNAYQILEKGSENVAYSKFLELVNYFPEFDYNEQKTNEQPGAELGLEVDSLFDLTYPELAFDISNEKTHPPSGTFGLPENVSIRYHHGMVAPTNEALDQLINTYINVPGGWGTLERSPANIKRIIANTHMSVSAIYPSDFERGIYNGEDDLIRIEMEDVVHKEFGSNCTFIGVREPLVPNAFNSVAGPVYLQPGFSTCMYAIEESGLLPALKRRNKNYRLFVETDLNLRNDSSLMYDPIREVFSLFMIQGLEVRKYRLSKNDLRLLMLNHIAIDQPRGMASREFVPNLAGNYIIFDNETGEVSGTDITTVGYRGAESAPNFPRLISNGADNGETYEIDNWFSFKAATLYTQIQGSYPTFFNLLKKAGLVQERLYRFTFISDNEFYTVFIPSDEAIDASNLNSLSGEALRDALFLHFIQGHIIFTDGNKDPGYYETLRSEGSPSQYASDYTQINIETGIDMIKIKSMDGSDFTEISESEIANILTGITVVGDDPQVFSNIFNNAVIHEIDRVLKFGELDTQ